jgi:hypothetical protein
MEERLKVAMKTGLYENSLKIDSKSEVSQRKRLTFTGETVRAVTESVFAVAAVGAGKVLAVGVGSTGAFTVATTFVDV